MVALKDMLLAEGSCTRSQIEEALRNKVIMGGRLGTNLLELGYLDEETLVAALGRIHALPTVSGEGIAPAAEALQLLRARQADRLEMIPWRVEGRRLEVLCMDPTDLSRLDALAFLTGMDIRPLVVSEFRFWQLLAKHYGVERKMRYLTLSDQLATGGMPKRQARSGETPKEQPPAEDLMGEEDFTRYYHQVDNFTELELPEGPVGVAAGTTHADVAALPDGPGLVPLTQRLDEVWPGVVAPEAEDDLPTLDDADLELWEVVEEEEAPLPVPSLFAEVSDSFVTPVEASDPIAREQDAQAARSAKELILELTRDLEVSQVGGDWETLDEHDMSGLSFAEARDQLEAVDDRDAVARVVLRFGASVFRRVILFTVHRRMVLAWEAAGDFADLGMVRRLRIDLGADSAFATCVRSRAHYLGGLRKTESNIRFLKESGKQIPLSVFIAPVLVRGRVVNLIYGDNGHKVHCNNDIGEVLILAQRITASYEAMFQKLKAGD